ncbi:hypothetical protein PG994_002604 [Apiospora phragmitis]|uniref:Uncharacterized protein n=1 Tax=Apiospora phragmitis TaxID=2905665 RepID=A0ABR1W5L9_9PEZI
MKSKAVAKLDKPKQLGPFASILGIVAVDLEAWEPATVGYPSLILTGPASDTPVEPEDTGLTEPRYVIQQKLNARSGGPSNFVQGKHSQSKFSITSGPFSSLPRLAIANFHSGYAGVVHGTS